MTETLWAELFPDQPQPASDEAIIEALALEIRALRLLADNIVTTAIEQETDVRPAHEIQMAHDILRQLVLDAELFHAVIQERNRGRALAALEALCWVLHHDHNTAFAANMAGIQMRLAALGYRIHHYEEMQNTEGQ